MNEKLQNLVVRYIEMDNRLADLTASIERSERDKERLKKEIEQIKKEVPDGTFLFGQTIVTIKDGVLVFQKPQVLPVRKGVAVHD